MHHKAKYQEQLILKNKYNEAFKVMTKMQSNKNSRKKKNRVTSAYTAPPTNKSSTLSSFKTKTI